MGGYRNDRGSPEWRHPESRRNSTPGETDTREDDRGIRQAQQRLVELSHGHQSPPRKYDILPPDHNAVHQNDDFREKVGFLSRILTSLVKTHESDVEPGQLIAKNTTRSQHDAPRFATDQTKPILDTRSVLQACYESKWLIAILILIGMACGAAAMLSASSKYTASTSLFFDPKRTEFQWDGSERSSASLQASASLINSQIEILTSNAVLKRVVNELSLETDPEFALKGSGDNDPYAVASALQKALSTSRSDGSYVVAVNVTTGNPIRSAEIANSVVRSFQALEAETTSQFYGGVQKNLDVRLRELRAKLQAADDAVDQFRAKNDLVTAKGELISEDRLVALSTALVAAQQKTIEAQAKVDAAKRLSPANAAAGISNNEVTSATLVALHRQYATAASTVGQLESQLGANHPTLAAAKASLNGLSSEIRDEVKRISLITQSDLDQAKQAERQTGKELATQKALKLSKSSSQGELDKLELQSKAIRDIYEAVLKRAREASEEQNVAQSNVRVIEAAEPPLRADGPGRSLRLIGGLFGGALLGLGLGLAIAITRRILRHPLVRSYFTFDS
ncbi:GumC family protein [Roseibium algae]|uniref:GumC family protein n=1 Tax=Roseibium algae TaxID=3123038 RepID=A0ABU8TQ64_9HYPH